MTVENVVESVDSPGVPRREASCPAGPGGTAACGKQEQEVVMMVMKWKRLREGAQAPQRQTEGSRGGIDLRACVEAPVTLEPGEGYSFPNRPFAGGDPPGAGGAEYSAARGLGVEARGKPAQLCGGDRQRLPRGADCPPCGISGTRPTPSSPGSGLPSWCWCPCSFPRWRRWKNFPKTQRGTGGLRQYRAVSVPGPYLVPFPRRDGTYTGNFVFLHLCKLTG